MNSKSFFASSSLLMSCGRVTVVEGGNLNCFHPVAALDARDDVGQVQRDGKIVETLHDVAHAPRRIGLDLDDGEHRAADQGEPARHDEADVAGADDHHASTGNAPLDVHEALGKTRGVHARRAGAGNGDVADTPDTAPLMRRAHRQR